MGHFRFRINSQNFVLVLAEGSMHPSFKCYLLVALPAINITSVMLFSQLVLFFPSYYCYRYYYYNYYRCFYHYYYHYYYYYYYYYYY